MVRTVAIQLLMVDLNIYDVHVAIIAETWYDCDVLDGTESRAYILRKNSPSTSLSFPIPPLFFLSFPFPSFPYRFPSQLEGLGSAKRHVVHFERKMLTVTATSEILVYIRDYNFFIKKAIAWNKWHRLSLTDQLRLTRDQQFPGHIFKIYRHERTSRHVNPLKCRGVNWLHFAIQV